MSKITSLRLSFLAAICAAILACEPIAANDPPAKATSYPYVVFWSGHLADEGLRKAEPKQGIIESRDAFRALWKAWSLGELVPEVDFNNNFIFVQTIGGANRLAVTEIIVDEAGKATTSTVVMGEKKGFAFCITVFPKPKTKIVEINGKKREPN